MRRIVRVLTVTCVAAAALVAGAELPAPASALAATEPTFAACPALAGPGWTLGGESGSRWLFSRSAGMACSTGRRFVDLLGPRVASSGTVDVQRFTTSDGWACLAGRSLGLGLCTSRAGGTSRTVFVVTDSRQGQALLAALNAGGSSTVLGPLLGSGGGSGGLIDLDSEQDAVEPTPCTPRPGSAWSRTAQGGNMWHSWAGGGITCLAAQGWVIDVSARMPLGPSPRLFDGGDGWRCLAGPTAGGQRPRAARRRLRANDELAHLARAALLRDRGRGVERRARAAHRPRLRRRDLGDRGCIGTAASAVQRCGHKGLVWQIGAARGNTWLVGTSGGYPCVVAASAAVKLLAQTATRDCRQDPSQGRARRLDVPVHRGHPDNGMLLERGHAGAERPACSRAHLHPAACGLGRDRERRSRPVERPARKPA